MKKKSAVFFPAKIQPFLYAWSISLFLLFPLFHFHGQSRLNLEDEAPISQIKINGLKTIDRNLIFYLLESRIGQVPNARTISNDLKSIFELGYFKDVRADYEPDSQGEIILIFNLSEKPSINKITFNGNFEIPDKTLSEKITTVPFQIFDEERTKQDMELIRKEYVGKGYYNVRLDYEIKETNEDHVELIFNIRENIRTYLQEINIKVIGKPVYYPLDLKRRLLSSEADCFAWIKSSGLYDEERINQDLAVITQTYLLEGYIRVKISRPDIKLIHNPDYSRFVVDFEVTEGDQYFVGDITIDSLDGNEFLVEEEELRALIGFKTGDVYNPFETQQSRIRVSDVYQSRGYAFSYVSVREEIDDVTKKVHLSFGIHRGEKVYINRINLQGNENTYDHVIRRELTIHDNELFNGVKVRESKNNLERLGYFAPDAGVVFNRDNIQEENKVDYNIKLKGTSTGTINGSLTYNDQSGFGLTGSVSKRNFRGLGQTISTSLDANTGNNQNASVTFTEPYFLGRKVSSTSSITYSKRDGSNYDTRGYGLSQGFSTSIWKNWSVSANYSWNQYNYFNINSEGEEALDGQTTSSARSLRLGLIYYTVNNPQYPSNGLDSRLYVTDTGGFLGGTQHYWEANFLTQYFRSISEDSRVVFMTKYKLSKLFKKGNNSIPVSRRYQIGGPNTIRGFDYFEIEGATSKSEYRDGFDPDDYDDSSSDLYDPDLHKFFVQSKGGTVQSILNFELLFPLTREGFNVRGVVFYDLGNVWQDDDAIYDFTGAKKDYSYMRRSYGFGVRLITGGFGVMRFEYGIKADKKPDESGSEFHFTISSLF